MDETAQNMNIKLSRNLIHEQITIYEENRPFEEVLRLWDNEELYIKRNNFYNQKFEQMTSAEWFGAFTNFSIFWTKLNQVIDWMVDEQSSLVGFFPSSLTKEAPNEVKSKTFNLFLKTIPINAITK